MKDRRQGTILILWRRVLIGITAAGAVVASFIFLTDLAVHAGWPSNVAWLLPLCIDSLAGMALTGYRLTGDRTAAAVAVLAIAFSAVGNAASHWYSTGLLTPDWITVTVVGAVPAVALGLCIHIATKGASWTPSSSSTETAGERSSADGSDTKTRNRQTPTSKRSAGAPAADGTHDGGKTSTPPNSNRRNSRRISSGNRKTSNSPKRTDTELISEILSNEWQQKSLNELTSLLSVSKSRATGLRDEAQRQLSPSPPDPAPIPSTNGQPTTTTQAEAETNDSSAAA